jgi:4-hydroxy-tetrahydrodipicolinate synthase
VIASAEFVRRLEAMAQQLPYSVAPIPTPLTANDRVDEGALRAHLGWLASEGLDGALVLGTTGEFPSLSSSERRQVAEAGAKTQSDLQLILGVGSCALGEVLELTRVASDNGYCAVLLPPPFYFKFAATGGIADFLRRVLDRSPLPVLLYHIPQLTGVPISHELLDAIGEHERLAGVKDSSGKAEEFERLLEQFVVRAYYTGSDRMISSCIERGGHGSISAAACVVPELVASIRRQSERQPDLDAIRGLLEEYGLVPAIKTILRFKGLGAYSNRPPMVGLDPERERALLQRFGGLAREG